MTSGVIVGPRGPAPLTSPSTGWGFPSWLVVFGAAAFVGALAGFGPAAGLVGLAAAGFAVVVLFHPLVGALVLTAVVPAAAGLRRGFPVPGFRLAELAIVGIASLVLLARRQGEPVRWHAFDWLAFAYAAGTFALGSIDLLERGAPFSSANVGTLVGPLQFFLLYRAVRTAVTSASGRGWCLRLILLVSIPVTGLALAQQLNVPGVRAALDKATTSAPESAFAHYLTEGLGRATGPFDHPHTLGAYLFIVILISAGLLLAGDSTVLPRWALLVVLAGAFVGQASTFTATPLIAAVVGVLTLGAWYQKLGRVLFWLSIGVLLIGVAAGSLLARRVQQQYNASPAVLSENKNPLLPQSLAYRYQLWRTQYVPVMSGHWLTGYGPDVPAALPGTVPWIFSENLYISLVLRGGIPLLLIFAGLMWALFLSARGRTHDPDPVLRVIARVVTIMVVLFVGMHMIEPYFTSVGVTHLFWALCGLLFARPR